MSASSDDEISNFALYSCCQLREFSYNDNALAMML